MTATANGDDCRQSACSLAVVGANPQTRRKRLTAVTPRKPLTRHSFVILCLWYVALGLAVTIAARLFV
jgi:hypothetical protein